MIDASIQKTTTDLIADTLGADRDDLTPATHFYLDLNATTEEMIDLKDQLETAFDINLPDFSTESPQTVGDLYVLLDDSLL